MVSMLVVCVDLAAEMLVQIVNISPLITCLVC